MQKLGFGRRLMAMLLALTMILSVVPATLLTANAALGEIFDDRETTGLTGDINTKDTISWPIKIYDYLNDGMLFEYSSAQDTSIYPTTGGSYGGGKPMPMIPKSTSDIVGEDYTSVAGYYRPDYTYTSWGSISSIAYTSEKHAFLYWGNKSEFTNDYDSNTTEVVRSINQPEAWVSPMSLHLKYDHSTSATEGSFTKSYGWVSNFARDNGKYFTGDRVRYMVIVYKTNDVYPVQGHVIRPYWAVSDSDYDTDNSYWSGSIDISSLTTHFGASFSGKKSGMLIGKEVSVPQATSWSYLVVDMKTNYAGDPDIGIANNWTVNWDDDSTNELDLSTMERVAGVGMSYPLCGTGEEMDISHIAYFSSAEEAKNFGDMAVEFDNEPGEYIGYTMSMTHKMSGGGAASASEPVPTNYGYNMWSFTNTGNAAWSSSTFTEWSNSLGMTTVAKNDFASGGFSYVNVSNTNTTNPDTAYIWKSGWTYVTTAANTSYTQIRYITMVYRTHGISDPKIGFWLDDSNYDNCTVGKNADYRVSITASENEWQYLTFDLEWLKSIWKLTFTNKVDTFNTIGIMFPGFVSGQSMDIAYIDYRATEAESDAFGQAAVAYLNSFVSSGNNSVTTTVSRSSSVKATYNMGSNQAFTMLYGSTGGGWLTDDSTAGGTNSKSNGYFNYQIGYSYMHQGVSSQVNTDRVTAKNNGYPVSDSIFLLNTYSSDTDYLAGVDVTYDSDGDIATKRFDMSKLELGYTLYNTMKDDGVMTAGLLQSGMASYKGMDGEEYRIMQYKDETILYIATLLRQTLVIPSRDGNGYNYNYVKGTRSPLFYEDWDGDGKLDTIDEDLDGDGHLDIDEYQNGEGILESEDLDRDGHLDVYEDKNENGHLDESEDLDGDGHLDVDEDLDGDGLIDPGEDVDGDGKLDVNEDANENGVLDLSEDVDGDGKLDVDEDTNGNGVLDMSDDLDGDGKLDREDEDKDGDGNLDINEKAHLGNGDDVLDGCDLASALRTRLGISFDDSHWTATTQAAAQNQPNKAPLGSYAETSKKFKGEEDANNNGELDPDEDLNGNGRLDKDVNLLIGPYLKCAPCIETFYDAAYYLLHNIFIPGSYNHVETDYNYLVMSKGYVTDEDKYAYVFDAGFTYKDGTSATVYDDVKKTISQAVAEKKHHIVYSGDNTTTLHPFLPINDSHDVAGAAGSEFKPNRTPYVREDGAMSATVGGSTYSNRNYNYVMTANGEFVYHEGDGLFFDFEGDDDVYMFVNGELVLDIGAAHSITKVGFNMNKYVDAAREALEFLKQYGYKPAMDDDNFLAMFTASTINKYTFDSAGNVISTTEISNPLTEYSSDEIQELLRQHRLNLVDGNSYEIDFYYMERHGWGANMRIATNIVMTDPDMITDKTAYQGTDANGNPQEITYGSLIDDSQPVNYSFSMTNKGNTKLYKLSFADENIGVDISAANGLQVFGKATTTKFTVTGDTTLSVSGLNGIFDLNGANYNVRADGTITWTDGETTRSAYALPLTYDNTDKTKNDYTLTLYQYDNSHLFNDLEVNVTLGSGATTYKPEADQSDIYFLKLDAVNTVKVLGVRVADAKGGLLDPQDLTLTVDGYATPEDYAAYEEAYAAYLEQKAEDPTIAEFDNKWCIDTIHVSVSNNAELKAFLTNLQDPKSQTGEGEGVPPGVSALYYGGGLWQNATVTISGIWYSLSEDEQADKVFTNTVYTKAYKSINSDDPVKGQDTHRVYSPGEPMYYQWADKPVFLEFDKLWTDVVNASESTVNSLKEQNAAIKKLTSLGVDNLDVSVVDRNGGKVAAINNYYEMGKWTTLPGSERTASDGYRTIYFKQIYDWKDESDEQQVYVYYWSNTNKQMTKWPGERMSYTKTDTDGKQIYQVDIPSNARYVIFSNGINSDTRVQTEDIPVPIVDYDKVSWDSDNRVLNVNFDSEGMRMFYVKVSGTVTEKNDSGDNVEVLYTAMVPVTFYVTYVEDKTFVLDYGLVTEELTRDGALFARDGLLGNHNTTQIKLMGFTTQEPSYTTAYTSAAAENGDINRILFTPEAGTKVTEGEQTLCYDMGDGKVYVSEGVGTDGMTINYNSDRYLMNRKIWFEPTDFMDQEYNLWLALSVHEKTAAMPSETPASGQSQYHAPAPSGEGSVDIATEVQMYKKLTIVPATVVYYEDDFSGVTYTGDQGKFEHYGEGSGTLTQGVNQTVPYGQDSTYQSGSNSEYSGASMTTINIADTSDVASFSFKGTGFEIISRTNAFDSASFVVTVKDSNGNVIKNLPIITEFTSSPAVCDHRYHNTNGYCTYCGKSVSHTYVNDVCTVCHAPRVNYYLMGYINGADHDAASTQYRFEDGKITCTFDSDSYLVVHDSNGKQYWTNGYAAEATSVMLFDLNSFTEEQQKSIDKLRVPGGVEVTLTLVDNGNGALVLGYTHDPIQHGNRVLYYDNSTTQWENVYVYYWSDGNDALTTWPGEQMAPVITEDNLYYYQVPSEAEYVVFNKGEGGSGNQTSNQTIPGDNYVFKDGKWFVYGEEEPVTPMMTIYYDNTNGWEAPYAYYWSAANRFMVSWPGTAMTLVEGTIYSVEIPADAENIIFSNNAASQSADLTIPGANYLYSNDTWSEYVPAAPTSNTIYFDNGMYKWSKVMAHYWPGSNATTWPGLEMTLVEGTIYSIEVPLDITNILFHNGNGTQTSDLDVPGDDYLFANGTWMEYKPGDATTYTVFFDNSYSKFANPSAHFWNGSVSTTMPGVQMTLVANDLYSVEVPFGISNIIFSDSGSNQTSNLVIPGENYVFDIGWHIYGEEVTYRTVYFKNSGNWSKPTVYYWSNAIVSQMHSWPGVVMTDVGDGIYAAEVRTDAQYVVFSDNGSDSQKTGTITLDADLPCYVDNGWTTYPPAKVDRQLYYKNVNNWANVYVYYWSEDDNAMVSWPGVPMTYMYGQQYSALLPTDAKFVMFNDGTPTQKLTLGSGDLYADGQWSYFLEESGRTIYYKNTNNWKNPMAYVLTASGEVVIKSMVKATGNYYAFVVPTNAVDITFADGATEGMKIPTVNDTYLPDGTWANAYLYSERVIYFKLPEGWKTPYIYGEGSYTGDAPGVPMTKLAGTEDIYFYDTECMVWSVTFSDVKEEVVEKTQENGTTIQETVLTVLHTTGEVAVPNVTNNYYVDGKWDVYGDKIIFFRNYLDLWDGVYAYYWHTSTGEDDPSISGKVQLTPKNDYANYFYCVIPAEADYISFAKAMEDKVTLPAASDQIDVYNKSSILNAWTKYNKQLVYFKNTGNLEQPYVYYWAQNDQNMVTWCGVKMNHLEGDIWYYELPASASFAFFSSGNISNRLVLPTTDNMYDGEKWVTYVTGETKQIHQVPVIRVTDLPYGQYTVTISGMPTYKDDTDWSKYQDQDYMASQVQTTYLYLDGVRIYQPLTASNSNYSETENGATFTELRNLILDGKAAVATYDQSAAFYTGNLSWSENRNGFEETGADGSSTTNYLCNQLTGINDYMTVGPNNEVYVNGNVRDEAVIFYVKETGDSKDHTLQIAARALDNTLFLSGKKSELAATLYQGVVITHPDGTTSYGWDALDMIESGTEQYYVIDYTKCPYDAATGNYQVALYVRNGMVSFSMVKYKGLDISSTGMSKTDYKYTSDGRLVEINAEEEGNDVQAQDVVFNLASVSAQMASAYFVGEGAETDSALTVPTLQLVSPSLSFDDEIRYNVYFTASDVENVVDMGLAIFDERLTDGTIADATEVVAGVVTRGDEYMAHTRGIAAKNMGDMVYFKVYAKLSDGSYVYSDVAGYNAVAYAKSMLANSDSAAMKALVVSMLNYGAAAQKYFGYKTDALMNADLTAEQQALVADYDESMVANLMGAHASKLGSFAATAGGFSKLSASVSFEGAFSINYYFTPGKSVDGDVTMYYWTAETYNSASELTTENAFASYTMVPGAEYWGSVVDIAAKEMDETVYVAAVYTSGGELCSTGVLAYSLGRYCETIAADETSGMQTFAQATAVYGSYAKDYFAN